MHLLMNKGRRWRGLHSLRVQKPAVAPNKQLSLYYDCSAEVLPNLAYRCSSLSGPLFSAVICTLERNELHYLLVSKVLIYEERIRLIK